MSLEALFDNQQRDTSLPTTPFIPARVRKVYLDDSNKVFGWNAVGYIKFDTVIRSSDTPVEDLSIARPFFPNIKNYPLENEIVFVFSLPDSEIQEDTNSSTYYYLTAINIWNSQHHNAVPDNIYGSSLPESQQKDYLITEKGSFRRVTDGSTEISLGKTFKEQSNIYPLLPYEGDVIVEGRFGNSIRLGSTVPANNFWKGKQGPITIISNGHNPALRQNGWVPTVESITSDQSILVLSSNQTLEFSPRFTGNGLEKFKVDAFNKYKGSQAVVSADRIVLAAKADATVIGGLTSVNINSQNISVESDENLIINAAKVSLGLNETRYPTEPVILGSEFLNDLSVILDRLSTLVDQLSTLKALPEGALYANLVRPSARLQKKLAEMKDNIDSRGSKYLSKKVFVSK